MKPVEGLFAYGVHKDLTGIEIDDPQVVSDTYEFVQSLGNAFKNAHPEIEFLDETVVDVVFQHPLSKNTVQRVEWQALARESANAQG